ncbi:MAG: hypothetical protein JXA69_02395 [Phycisphaerae bacterium]|nr:hypothetical protein [Phycisphaerae bacterium]
MTRRNVSLFGAAMAVGMVLLCSHAAAAEAADTSPGEQLRTRLEQALDQWCRWLSGYLYEIPGTDLYTLNPTLGTGANPYRDVAGNQFAAAAAGYWLSRANPPEEIARPLRGLIKLALGTHIAVNTIDRPDIQKWGASLSNADDWHADLFVVAQGMLMLDGLPPEQREQLRAMLAWEADKQTEYGISKKWRTWPGRWPAHSCGESNAWSATELAMARLAWPGDARQAAWRETAIMHSVNAICMPADMESDTIVAGKPLRERVKGANFEPGGTQEHHGFYHPGYMGWPLAYQAYAWLIDQALPEAERDPDVYLHNWKYVFDRLKQGTLSNGRFVYAAGYDWISYGYGNTQFMPAAIFAAAHFKDADASRLASEWLSLIEQQQALTGGSVQGARLATLQRLKLNDFAWYEGQEGCCLAQALWVLDRVAAEAIPPAATEAEYNERHVGTYHEPNARLAWHRTRDAWASVSWRAFRSGWQFIAQPVGFPHLLKHNENGCGILEVSGTTPKQVVESFRMGTLEPEGIWTVGRIGRETKRVIHSRPDNQVFPLVRQHQAFVSLPDGVVVLIDYCEALDQVWLLRSGGLGLYLAADVFNENSVELTVGAETMRFGHANGRDVWHDLGSRRVTVEKQLAIEALVGEGTFQLLQKRGRSPNRSEWVYANDPYADKESLLAHELYFGLPAYERPRIVSPGEWFRKMVLVIRSGATAGERVLAGSVIGKYPCIGVSLPDSGCTLVVNFADTPESLDTPQGRVSVEAMGVTIAR